MPVLEIKQFGGGISDYEDKGITGSFKFGKNLNIRKKIDSLSCNQALQDEGLLEDSRSPSLSLSPSLSVSQSASPSVTASPSSSTSPSLSGSGSQSASSGVSPSPSLSPSISPSSSASPTPSRSVSLSPSASGGLDTVYADLVLWFVNASDGYTYEFGNTGWIYRRDSEGIVVRVYKDSEGKIKGAIEKPSENGVRYLVWATNLFVNIKPIPGLANWNDVNTTLTNWPKGNLDSADWHTMAQIGGSAYIANNDKLALVGYDDSYTNEALDVIPGNIIKTIVERNGRAILGTYKAANSTNGINGAIDAEFPLAQIGEDGEVFFANGNDSIAFKRFPGGGKINPDGVDAQSKADFFEWEETALSWISKQEIKSVAYFGVFGAETGKNGIYSIGRENKNKPFIMNLEYALEVDEIGAITFVDDGTLLASYRDGTDFGVKAVDPDNKAVAEYEGLDFKAPVKNPEKPTSWNLIELFHDPLPSGATLEVFYRVNKTGEFVRAKTAKGDNVFSKALAEKSTFAIGANGDVFEPKVILTPTGNSDPEVHRIRSYFT